MPPSKLSREMMTNESHFHHFLLEDMMLKHELKVIKCNLSHFVKKNAVSNHDFFPSIFELQILKWGDINFHYGK